MTGFKWYPRFFLCFLLAAPAWLQLHAAHIIGGNYSYVCNGNGSYTFTLKIYRDCNGGGAPFDSDFANNAPFAGTVTIFEGDSNSPLNVINLPTPQITKVLPNLSNPCLVAPPNVCVEEGVYVFDLDLPVIPESYHIVYQRCCRNSSISNIVSPGETGATYHMELTAKAQEFCNNSPVFADFPPIAICTNEPIDFDHSATDPDGDVLKYELCAPIIGGGTDQVNAEAADGVAPNPDIAPPYAPVSFITPTYSFSNPLVANPQLSIDPNTGFLTGVPQVTGQFVVGVCVKEYRNGVLLSETRRDFQFNVAKCDPTVVADISEDDTVSLQGQQYYVVNACGENSVVFKNESYQQASITEFRWEFGIAGTTQTFNAWSPTVDFPDTGTYYGLLLLNPGTACADTAFLEVNVFPGISADFEFDYDTCKAGPVVFTDLSYSGAGPGTITDWDWSFGDGGVSTDQHPVHTYLQPGELPVQLLIRDINDCTGLKTETIPYFPVPQLLVVAPSDYIGCQPAEILFDNLSTPVNDSYDLNWVFGDGGTSDAISPTYIYDEPGTYTVSLEIISPLGCQIDTTWENLITVLPSPVADFSYSPPRLSNLQPTAIFTDESQNAVKWKWTFGNTGYSIEQNPVHTFPDTGLQVVQLVVFHQSGCTDTTVQLLDVIPEVRYFLPNAFTPNGDAANDGFRGNGAMEGASEFTLSIWNRYGEKLFETGDPFEAWNGRKNNTGELSPQGVYVVTVRFKGPRGEKHEIRGYATLIK